MRIATWNVNSVKQRVPRLLPWLDERRPDVVCLQETKLADDAFRELLGEELEQRGYAVAVHGEATWNGVAILSRVGLDDVVAGVRGRARLPGPGGARGVGHLRRHPGGVGVRAERAHAGLRALPLQARLAGVAAGDGRGGPRGHRRLRRHEHRAHRRRRLRSRRLHRPDARDRARAGGAGAASGARPARRGARALARRAGVQLLGLPRRDVPPGPRHAHRPGPRQRARGRAGPGGLDRPPGPQGQRAERPRPGDGGPRRGAGRGHRAGGAAAVAAGDQARREEAAAGA